MENVLKFSKKYFMKKEKAEENLKKYSEYLCQKCGKFFLGKDFNLDKHLCKKCWNMKKKKELENVEFRV